MCGLRNMPPKLLFEFMEKLEMTAWTHDNPPTASANSPTQVAIDKNAWQLLGNLLHNRIGGEMWSSGQSHVPFFSASRRLSVTINEVE